MNLLSGAGAKLLLFLGNSAAPQGLSVQVLIIS
jgi:hypothetical protein